MSTLIRRTNPDLIRHAWGARWRCAACQERHETAEEARACAEADHATGRHNPPFGGLGKKALLIWENH